MAVDHYTVMWKTVLYVAEKIAACQVKYYQFVNTRKIKFDLRNLEYICIFEFVPLK